MFGIIIRDGTETHGHLTVDLKKILSALGDRISGRYWEISAVADYSNEFDVVGKDSAKFENLRNSAKRIGGSDLELLSRLDHQLIWAEIRGYPVAQGGMPQIVIRVIDSTYFEVLSEKMDAIEILGRKFRNVEFKS